MYRTLLKLSKIMFTLPIKYQPTSIRIKKILNKYKNNETKYGIIYSFFINLDQQKFLGLMILKIDSCVYIIII